MEFLKLIDATDKLKDMKEKGTTNCDVDHVLKYFIQEDVHDFHVFRVIEGTYDEDYEGREDEVLTIEHQKVCKYDVLQSYGFGAKSRKHRDNLLKNFSDQEIMNQIIILDDENGFENWDYKVAESMDEAVEIVTQDGFYQVI